MPERVARSCRCVTFGPKHPENDLENGQEDRCEPKEPCETVYLWKIAEDKGENACDYGRGVDDDAVSDEYSARFFRGLDRHHCYREGDEVEEPGDGDVP